MSGRRRPKRLGERRRYHMVACGAGALLVVLALFLASRSSSVTPVPSGEEFISISVPKRMVARGERLGDVPTTVISWPRSRLSPDYLESIDLNSVSLVPLPPLLPVPKAAVSSNVVSANAVVEEIPEGMRAITVAVDAESAVEGWARNGNFVDVILIQRDGELRSSIIAQNVRILSAGFSTSPESSKRAPDTATLLVTQEEGLRIKTAALLGKLTFALRGPRDGHPSRTTSVDEHEVLGRARLAPAVQYRGQATGPDGKRYLLTDTAQWIQSEAR